MRQVQALSELGGHRGFQNTLEARAEARKPGGGIAGGSAQDRAHGGGRRGKGAMRT